MFMKRNINENKRLNELKENSVIFQRKHFLDFKVEFYFKSYIQGMFSLNTKLGASYL